MSSHITTGEWQSFEARMRRRRAERLAVRADAAAAEGRVAEARECLAEARQLAPALPVFDELERKLEQVDRRRTSHRMRWRTAAAVAVLAAGGAMAAVAVRGTRPRPLPLPPVSTTRDFRGVASLPHSEAEARREAALVPRTREAPAPARAVATVGTDARPEPDRVSSAAAQRFETRRVLQAGMPVLSLPPATGPAATEPAAIEPAVRLLPGASLALPLAETPAAALPAPDSGTAPAPPAEAPPDALVRRTLDRYAAAYSDLDAEAARKVWPGVNRAALVRAFSSLASQEVSLGECRVDVSGASARARCAGSATWAPRVGSGAPKTEPRVWDFSLVKADAGWQIVNARVQNR